MDVSFVAIIIFILYFKIEMLPNSTVSESLE